MTRRPIRVIDALAVVLLAGASLAGAYNAVAEAREVSGPGQASVVGAQAVYVVAGGLVLWA